MEGFFDVDGGKHDDHAGCHCDDKTDVEQKLRKGEDQHCDHENHAHPENEVGVLENFCEGSHCGDAVGVVFAYGEYW